MARKPPIKWRESDAEKLTKEIQKFNAKIYRTKSKHPELENILPETIKKADKQKMVEELKQKPRAEFKKQINSLDRFLNKGAEKAISNPYGVTITKWEKKEVSLKGAQINRERTKERKAVENMSVTSRGESVGLKRGEMGSERMNELKPKKVDFNKVRNKKEWEKLKSSVEKLALPESREKRYDGYKANYIQGLKNAFGEYANDIIDIIQDLPAKLVVDTYYGEQEATITFMYEKQDMDTKLDILSDIWQGVNADYENEINR